MRGRPPVLPLKYALKRSSRPRSARSHGEDVRSRATGSIGRLARRGPRELFRTIAIYNTKVMRFLLASDSEGPTRGPNGVFAYHTTVLLCQVGLPRLKAMSESNVQKVCLPVLVSSASISSISLEPDRTISGSVRKSRSGFSFSKGTLLSITLIALRRALCLSFDRITVQGAVWVWLLLSISYLTWVNSSHRSWAWRSISLNFHCLNGSLIRASKRLACS